MLFERHFVFWIAVLVGGIGLPGLLTPVLLAVVVGTAFACRLDPLADLQSCRASLTCTECRPN